IQETCLVSVIRAHLYLKSKCKKCIRVQEIRTFY
ncbi:transmembrane protein, partial [Toxoplasma gondii p89]